MSRVPQPRPSERPGCRLGPQGARGTRPTRWCADGPRARQQWQTGPLETGSAPEAQGGQGHPDGALTARRAMCRSPGRPGPRKPVRSWASEARPAGCRSGGQPDARVAGPPRRKGRRGPARGAPRTCAARRGPGGAPAPQVMRPLSAARVGQAPRTCVHLSTLPTCRRLWPPRPVEPAGRPARAPRARPSRPFIANHSPSPPSCAGRRVAGLRRPRRARLCEACR